MYMFLEKLISIKTFLEIIFFLPSFGKVNDKTAGSGSTPKCHGSATLSTTLINTTTVCNEARVSDPDSYPESH
jgi:hypothetical protein